MSYFENLENFDFNNNQTNLDINVEFEDTELNSSFIPALINIIDEVNQGFKGYAFILDEFNKIQNTFSKTMLEEKEKEKEKEKKAEDKIYEMLEKGEINSPKVESEINTLETEISETLEDIKIGANKKVMKIVNNSNKKTIANN